MDGFPIGSIVRAKAKNRIGVDDIGQHTYKRLERYFLILDRWKISKPGCVERYMYDIYDIQRGFRNDSPLNNITEYTYEVVT